MLMFYSYSGLCEHWQTKSLPVLLLLCLFSHYYSSTKVVLVAYLLLNTDVGIQTRGRTAKELLWAPPAHEKAVVTVHSPLAGAAAGAVARGSEPPVR